MKKSPQELGLDSALCFKNLTYARARLEFWSERYSLASAKLDSWTKEEARLNAQLQGKPFEAVPYATY